ncbi:MAG: MaoC/PaaZ C-terminal domain-containing protein [Lapillicoccus sp.]
MSVVLRFDAAPDLRRVFVGALSGLRRHGSALPDVVAVRRGVVVDPAAVAGYAHTCGFTLGLHPPVTWPHLLGFPLQAAVMARGDFPTPLVGLVHVRNTMAWTRPLGYGETVDVEVRAEGLRPHRKGRTVDLVTVVSAGDEVVWRSVSTYLARGPGDETAPADPMPDVSDLRSASGASRWRVDEGAGRRYAAVSGDVNPIHLHALSARLLGFDRAIAHGMFTYAHSLAAFGARIPAAGASSVWFRQPVRLPSTVRLGVAADATRAVLYPEGRAGEHLVLTVTPAST